MEFSTQTNDDWFRDAGLPWWGDVAKRLLEWNELPNHVAFVMDGNRRYARRLHMNSVLEGHSKGFEQMTKVLDWCRVLGVKEVTVYAFSVDNFKRSKDEVDGLMKIAETKFLRLLQEKDKLAEREVCFRFFGDTELLPERIQRLVANIEEMTSHYTKGYVNVCLSYSSQREIARAMEWIRRGVKSELISETDINAQLMADCLDSRHSLPVDLLIRTSGEHRLSDFLLWQCSNCYIHFEDVFWPEIKFWHLFKAIVNFQRTRAVGLKLNAALAKSSDGKSTNQRVTIFLEWMNAERRQRRVELASAVE